jgi:iron transport multicopper oxidase
MAAFAAMYIWFEGHEMLVVEVDGIYTVPTPANMIYMTAAQRYSVLVTAKNNTDANFPLVASMDQVRQYLSLPIFEAYFGQRIYSIKSQRA